MYTNEAKKMQLEPKNINDATTMVELRDENLALAALYEPPEPGDKFEFVMVKCDQRYTLQGLKIEIKRGDQMEFPRVYRWSQQTANPQVIDLSYYMEGSIAGIMSRFIAYHDKFQPPVGAYDVSDKEQYRDMDIVCVNAATAHIMDKCYEASGIIPGSGKQTGLDYRKIYSTVDKALRNDIVTKHGAAGYILYGLNTHVVEGSTESESATSTRIVNQIKELAEELSLSNRAFGTSFVNIAKKHIDIFALRRIYCSDKDVNISKQRIRICDRGINDTIEKLFKVIPNLIRILFKYEKSLFNIIEDMRKDKSVDRFEIDAEDINYIHSFSEQDSGTIHAVYDLCIKLIALYKIKVNTTSIMDAIEVAKCADYGQELQIDNADIMQISLTDTKKSLLIPDYIWQ